jgi:thiol:disulfide interchange protein DsbA
MLCFFPLVNTLAENAPEFQVLSTPIKTAVGPKIEVIEFFWYNCPHCNAFDPELEAWVKKQGSKISFKRVPVSFRPSFVPQQRLFYTLEALGKLENLHSKVFAHVHKEQKKLDTDEMIAEFVATQGIDKQKYKEVSTSFGVDSKIRLATQLQADYKIQGVPTIAIDGRFITSPSILAAKLGRDQPGAVLHAATLKTMDTLVARAIAERRGTSKSSKKQK